METTFGSVAPRHQTARTYSPMLFLTICHRGILCWPLSEKMYQILGTFCDTVNSRCCALCAQDEKWNFMFSK